MGNSIPFSRASFRQLGGDVNLTRARRAHRLLTMSLALPILGGNVQAMGFAFNRPLGLMTPPDVCGQQEEFACQTPTTLP